MPQSESSAEPWLDALWQQVEADWSNDSAHQALLAQCDTPARLAAVARRYREASCNAARAPVAQSQLNRITALAFGHLTPREPRRPASHGWKVAWLVLLLVGIAALWTQR